jgi:hypothetical protein
MPATASGPVPCRRGAGTLCSTGSSVLHDVGLGFFCNGSTLSYVAQRMSKLEVICASRARTGTNCPPEEFGSLQKRPLAALSPLTMCMPFRHLSCPLKKPLERTLSLP